MNLKLKAKLLRAKSILNKTSDSSYAYSQLEKEFGVSRIQDDETAIELLSAYNQIIEDLRQVVIGYETENEDKDNQN